jgi:hypothetical protein
VQGDFAQRQRRSRSEEPERQPLAIGSPAGGTASGAPETGSRGGFASRQAG